MPQLARPQPSASVTAYLEAVERPRRSYFGMPIDKLRRRYFEEFQWGGGELEPVAGAESTLAGGVSSRLYRTTGDERSVLVWFHGGGWNLGSIECHEWIARALANRAGCAVLSVGYRLAPEHPYPAAVDDAWIATLWATRQFDQVAVGGDSAGGNLAAVVAQRARDETMPLALQLLVYPVLDHRVDHPSYDDFAARYAGFAGDSRFGDDFQMTIRDIWEQYVPDPARRGETDASPLRADTLRGVAPVLMITAEHDILRPENEEYVHRLDDDDVKTEMIEYAGQIHGFFPLLGVMSEARDAVATSGRALSRAFARG